MSTAAPRAPSSPRRLAATLLLGAALTLGASACEPGVDAAQAAPPAPVPGQRTDAVPITLAPVARAEATRPVRATGRVTHDRDLRLGFKTGGVLAEVTVAEGDRVVPGQPLARLDRAELDAGVAQARSALTKARRDLERLDRLTADAVLPAATGDDARTALAVARAQLDGARFNQDTATLEATVTGVVLKRLAEPGEVVGPGQPVLVLGVDAADGVRVEVAIPPADALRLRPGDRAEVHLDGLDALVPATVVELAPSVTPATGDLRATLRLEPTPGHPALPPLPRGLAATATLTPSRGEPVAWVPLTTLVEGRGDRATVWVLAGERPVAHEVRVGWLDPDGRAAILAGLDGVERVIDAGSAWLSASTRVEVVATTVATSAAPAPTR